MPKGLSNKGHFCTCVLYQLAGRGPLLAQPGGVMGCVCDYFTKALSPPSRTQNSVAPATAAGIIRMLTKEIINAR
ncbi:hypothetical protein FQZ97_669540 [compost metagenome]